MYNKPDKLTKGQNLIWASSRMMLPEHIAMIREHRLSLTENQRPHIDDQQWQVMARRLQASYKYQIAITIMLFTLYGNYQRLQGTVEKIFIASKSLKIDTHDEWLSFHDMIDVWDKTCI